MEMEWEIPVLEDLNMATFAGACDPTGGTVAYGICGTIGSGANNSCAEGSGFTG